MRAWRVHQLGEPRHALVLDEVEDPRPGADEVLVRVAAAALNFPDVLLCEGSYQERPDLPFTPGFEVAGRIVAGGPGAGGLDGRRIAGMCRLPRGGLAEMTVLPRASALPIPAHMSYTEAASLQVTYHTAYAALHRRAAIQAGETLLVHAGAGGVGSAAIQVGVAAGARVIATAGGTDKVAVCRNLGAEVAVDYTEEDFVDRILEHTAGRGADVVVDPVGGEVFDRSRKVVAFEGRIVVVGFASGRAGELATNHAMVKNYSVVGLHWGLYHYRIPTAVEQVHAAVVKLYTAGAVRPLISGVIDMAEVPAAMHRLSSRETIGKLVVRP